MLGYKITYVKSRNEVRKELNENVRFDYISNEIKNEWELNLDAHVNNKLFKEKESEIKKKQNWLDLKEKELKMLDKIEKMERELAKRQERTMS